MNPFKILIELNKSISHSYTKMPWIQWKNYSCRIDAFATVAYHIFFYDFSDTIFPPLTGPHLPDDLHPFGSLMKGIDEAKTLQTLQKAVDNYSVYRTRVFKEKIGKGADIFSLFTELKDMPQFIWYFSLNFFCNKCKNTNVKEIKSNVLFTITTSSLINSSGSISLAIQSSVSNYIGQCPKYHEATIIEKIITKIPNYYCCVLEYAEELQKGDLSIEALAQITIDDSFDFNNINFSLAGMINFQDLHYTAYVKGISHPKLLPKRVEKWFYHDGIKTTWSKETISKGLLFESFPILKVDLRTEKLKPYILIYRVVQNEY